MGQHDQRRDPTPAVFDENDHWVAPQTYRATLAAAEQVAAQLLAEVQGQMLVPVDHIEFLIRRLHRLTADAHAGLPWDVS